MNSSPTLTKSARVNPSAEFFNDYRAFRSNPVNLLDPMGLQATAAQENEAWNRSGYEALITQYLDFWAGWLGLADQNRNAINNDCKSKLRCLIRAISWVESRHGTGAGNQPDRDPMQVGNPNDPAWPHVTGQGPLGPRPIREGNRPGVEWPQIPGNVGNDPNKPGSIDPTTLPGNGHNSPQFTPNMSYFWGILWLMMKMNQDDPTPAGNKAAWNCQSCSWEHLLDGAQRYNSSPQQDQYRRNIEAALKLSGCM
jgi:hypothetical protein